MTPATLVGSSLFVIGLLFYNTAPLVAGFFFGLATSVVMGGDDDDDDDDTDGAEPSPSKQPT